MISFDKNIIIKQEGEMTMIKSDNVKNIYENKRVSKYNRSISHLNIARKNQ